MERVPSVSGTTTNLIDILDRILDKGLVIAGDIRLLICSVDKAEKIGLNWWKHDPNLTQPVDSHMGLHPGTVHRVAQARRSALARKTTKAKRKR
ncbi:MAG: hypothetical protein DMG67_09625 [Acidobacteria bacterium]|nr:MAG: hypothetical protein DMG67_09625 [Acidobacteriota bacterium]